jgi:deoxyxylulose-5-phosphate synthase
MLEQVRGPADLQQLSQDQLTELAGEIRQFLIHKVAATGGHLGPNLGVVELTLALHRVFESPHDPIIFDTGHQAYVHKMLTGRGGDFDTLADIQAILEADPRYHGKQAILSEVHNRSPLESLLGATALHVRSACGQYLTPSPFSFLVCPFV